MPGSLHTKHSRDGSPTSSTCACTGAHQRREPRSARGSEQPRAETVGEGLYTRGATETGADCWHALAAHGLRPSACGARSQAAASTRRRNTRGPQATTALPITLPITFLGRSSPAASTAPNPLMNLLRLVHNRPRKRVSAVELAVQEAPERGAQVAASGAGSRSSGERCRSMRRLTASPHREALAPHGSYAHKAFSSRRLHKEYAGCPRWEQPLKIMKNQSLASPGENPTSSPRVRTTPTSQSHSA